jgi:hypothetical protein
MNIVALPDTILLVEAVEGSEARIGLDSVAFALLGVIALGFDSAGGIVGTLSMLGLDSIVGDICFDSTVGDLDVNDPEGDARAGSTTSVALAGIISVGDAIEALISGEDVMDVDLSDCLLSISTDNSVLSSMLMGDVIVLAVSVPP